MSQRPVIPTRTTRSGADVPAIGFGTYRLNGHAGVGVVREALTSGYRLLDSAFTYENEGAVGRAVRTSEVPRADVLVASKLPGRHHAYDQARRTIEESVLRMGLDHIDHYLIHWPNPLGDRYLEAWRALIDARERGLVTEIGVCNFLPEHLDRLEAETGVLPFVNQIELHPYFPQVEALAYHRARGILTEGWAPLGRGSDLLANPTIGDVAAAYDVTPAQAVLAWHVAMGSIPLPKASSPARQRQNLDVFRVRLSDADRDRITALGRPDGRIGGLDPATHEEL